MEGSGRFIDCDTAWRALRERVNQQVEAYNSVVCDPAVGLFVLSIEYIPDPDKSGFIVRGEHVRRSTRVRLTTNSLTEIGYFYQESDAQNTLTWREQVLISVDPDGHAFFKRNGVLNTTDQLTLRILQPMLDPSFIPPENAQRVKANRLGSP